MQQSLPLTICEIFPKNVIYIITHLCLFFSLIFNKVIEPLKVDCWYL